LKLRLFSALVVLSSMTAFAWEQPTAPISVGDPLVSGKNLQPYKNTWRMSVTKADGSTRADAGTWTDELQAVKCDDRDCFKRIQIAKMNGEDGKVRATTETINVFYADSLAPLLRSYTKKVPSKHINEATRVEFRGNNVVFEKTESGKRSKTSVSVPAPVFDFYGGMYGLLLSAFPLQEGYSATLSSADEFEAKVKDVTFTVLGKEAVDAGPSGRRDAWIVESNTDQGPMKFWLSAQAPYVIHLQFTNKQDNMRWDWTMI
jgi:hypothetical protein